MSKAVTISEDNYNWLFDKATKWMDEIKKNTSKRKKVSVDAVTGELIKLAKIHGLPLPEKIGTFPTTSK